MARQGRWYSSPTQIYWACDTLLKSRVISTKSEIREVKGWRLAAIVERLKSKYGWPIETELRGKENVAHYFLPPGTDPATLNYPPSAKSLGDGFAK